MKYIALGATILALAACVETGGTATANMEGDMLPSAEVRAYQRVQVPAGYGQGRVAYDANNCAVIRATNDAGQVFERPLRDESGQRICS